MKQQKKENKENKNSKQNIANIKSEKIVPDTSVIIEGLISKKIISGELKPKEIIIHEAVLSELEYQANKNRETGYLGVDEIKHLREISKKYNFTILFKGKRPEEFEILYAKSGEIDSLIRDLAMNEKAVLVTADKVQSLIAETKGIPVVFCRFGQKEKRKLALEAFFDETTMSVHLRENVSPSAKKGRPGNWEFVKVRNTLITHEEIKTIAKEIVEEAGMRSDGFIEIQRKGSTIIQLGNFRIVICKPPLSDAWEITAVRPVKILCLDDYKLSDKLKQRISKQAEGILIAGAPGNGKSTFAQALAEFYNSQSKIVKTVEAPRDLQLSDSITQYAISHGSSQEIHDILLLSRPDYVIFDEMRNTADFVLFTDMRLSGVGMIGVVHGSEPIDSIQRFIGRIDLGVIPQVVDTVIFIKNGEVKKVFGIKMQVKVPSGMMEADLARPVVTVVDFETGKLEYEIYSYGEETVVVPVQPGARSSPTESLAAKYVEREFRNYTSDVAVEMLSANRCAVYVNPDDIAAIIGKGGQNIEKTEKKLGIGIEIKEFGRNQKKEQGRQGEQGSSGNESSGESPGNATAGGVESVEYSITDKQNNIVFLVDYRYIGKDVEIFVGDDYLLTARVGKKGKVKLKKDNKLGSIILKALNTGEKVELRI